MSCPETFPAAMAYTDVRSEQSLIGQTQAFENTSTSVAAAQMRNALTNLAETVEDTEQKKVQPLDVLIACPVC